MGLTEGLQQSRLIVVSVDRTSGHVRVRGEFDVCSELTCSEGTLVLTEEGGAGLAALQPGDIVKVEPRTGRPERVIIVRRAWEEIASPEL